MTYNTRIAPSLGTARTAYFNWLAARASGGKFLLRIDDTDPERSKQEYIDVILRVMDWLGLDYDSIQYQSKRQQHYRDVATQFVRYGIAKEKEGAVVFDLGGFLLLYPSEIRSWTDEIAGKIKITDDDLQIVDGMVLLRSDGAATYHFASCIDDAEFGINYIIRGVDHITNTARHIYLLTALNAVIPKFAHIGLIHFEGKKLSKRDGAASMLTYKADGFEPEAMLNFMARLGWGPNRDDKSTALLPREKMLELFLDGGRMRNSAANMDLMKLLSFHRKYKARKSAC